MPGHTFIFERDRFGCIHSAIYPQDNDFWVLRNICEGLRKSARINNIVETPMKIRHSLVLGHLVRFFCREREKF